MLKHDQTCIALQVTKRSEGSGHCYPTPSGPMATQSCYGGVVGGEQGLAELQGAESSVRGINRAALLLDCHPR